MAIIFIPLLPLVLYHLINDAIEQRRWARNTENFLDTNEEDEYETSDGDEESDYDEKVEQFWLSKGQAVREIDKCCSICLCDVDNEEEGFSAGLARCCGSVFHYDCTDEYWSRLDGEVRCPNCRHEV